MSEIILKWQFDDRIITVPDGDVLAVEFQHRILHAWVKHKAPVNEERLMHLRVVATGEIFKPCGQHVGSAVSDGYVWHVFKDYPVEESSGETLGEDSGTDVQPE